MKTYYLKIRDKFIEAIRNGLKKHEYRLATEERKDIKIGDTLVVISTTEKKHFVRVTVKKIDLYKNWEEALQANWSDFQNIYPSFEEAIRDCNRFYTRDEVNEYGIICYEIEPLLIDYKNISILLDTNIIIRRESSNNVSFEVASLYKWFDKKHITKHIHRLSKIEIQKHADEKVKQNMLVKMQAYDELPTFSDSADSYFNSVIDKYPKDENGKIDNALLLEVYNANVDILLTDDTLILTKAEELFLRDHVLSSTDLLKIIESTYPQNIEYKMLSVKLKPISEIDLSSGFFDTLREDYEGVKFDNWFKKKALHGESVYVFENETGLKGFLYLKVEDPNEPDYLKVQPKLTPKRRLKVGTFKIERTGFRLGERFLKIIFDNAKKHGVEEIYVTLFEHKRQEVVALKNLMQEWGFVLWGYKDTGEAVLVKDMKNYNLGGNPKFNYPIVKSAAKHFILPIYPQYHTDLFPDNILRNEDMRLYEENKGHRYAIEKMYLSAAYNIQAVPGDVVLIYRIGEWEPKHYTSVITGIAIIQEIIATKTDDERISICKDKSIFTEQEIRTFKGKYPIVVKLLDYQPFKMPVRLKKLREMNVVDSFSGPRPFMKITKEQFETICQLGSGEQYEE